MISAASPLLQATYRVPQHRRRWLPGWSLAVGRLQFAGCGKSPEQNTDSLRLENQGTATFANVSDKAGPFLQRRVNLRGCGVFDFDNDGRMDLMLTSSGGRAVLLRNRGANSNHWFTLKLAGSRSNRDSFGAQVKVTAGTRTLQAEARCPTSYVFQQYPRLHFGLGQESKVDRIEIRWPRPSGQTQVPTDVAVDQILRVQEP